MKILLAVDGSAYTQHMLNYLAKHQTWLVASNVFTVFYASEPLPHLSAAAQTIEKVRGMYQEDAELVFKPIRKFLHQHGVLADYVFEIGPAGSHIAQFAQKGHFDLIVMGSHGHGSVANLIMGSVATQVLSLCKTPVLLIR